MLFILFMVPAIAEVNTTQPAPSTASATYPALWKVTPANASATDPVTAYLFGSIHFGNKAMYPLAEPIMTAFQQADHLVVELDVTTLDPSEMGLLMLEKGMYQAEETLQKSLSPATWKSLDRLLTRHQLSADTFTKHQPWLVAIMLTGLEFQRAGYEELYGIDNYFLQQAKDNKPIIELESFNEQIELFAQLSPKEQEVFLEATVRELEQGTQYIEPLFASWMTGDEEKMNRLMLQPMKLDPTQRTFYDAFVKNRNIAMATKIDQLLKENKTLFVVVGSLHVIGDEGLVQLLTHKGYRAEKITAR